MFKFDRNKQVAMVLWAVLLCSLDLSLFVMSFTLPEMSRTSCEVTSYAAAWVVANRSIHILEHQHVELEMLMASKRSVQHTASLKCAARKLQRKNDLLARLIESFNDPKHEQQCYHTLRRDVKPLYARSDRLWVVSDQF
jgi:hypothetical protein